MKLYTHYVLQQAASAAVAVPVARLNIAPLIGVLTVLVIMLIITLTAPLHFIQSSTPSPQISVATSKVVVIKIDVNGFVKWNEVELEKLTEVKTRIASAANQRVQPKIYLQPAPDAPYAFVAGLLVMANKAGLQKIAVVN